MKHYKSVEFLSNFRVSSPPAQTQRPPQKRKAPYWKLSGDGSVPTVGERHHQRSVLPALRKRLEQQKGRPNVIVCAAEENLEEEL